MSLLEFYTTLGPFPLLSDLRLPAFSLILLHSRSLGYFPNSLSEVQREALFVMERTFSCPRRRAFFNSGPDFPEERSSVRISPRRLIPLPPSEMLRQTFPPGLPAFRPFDFFLKTLHRPLLGS